MTIQPSVLIWTIICFCLAMLILNRLLFRPMLAFMDKRAQRLADARERATRLQAQAAEAERAAAERKARREELARREEIDRLATARSLASEQLAALRLSEEQSLEAYRCKLSEQKPALESAVFSATEEFASSLAGQFLA